ncbi:serine/threonine-protein kinase TBK1-like [Xenia sp. Carnegie-2017]|uniref:serine/threonine-protein kinase TBK1-like n=1 Tax=Xenia sp. Carnegie-2017 TaxID=2897299 RepID=UPI001F049579|nr:serine/threonine-protein kinase TBK1-like [Xenia sp. Carnegie-2017]XP_046840741.1 serine/threonine-protein kinase TBK1-like [Xenia sp. Carnegie-2017]XP_046840742.1 serine/threonine-protein kinase TBK1-like [Xenia sp. Carnegie-2017]
MFEMRNRFESRNYFWYNDVELGHGATSRVFRCQHKETGKDFAVKIFSIQGMNRYEYQMKRELDVLKKLMDCNHPNIVKVIAIEKEMKLNEHAIIMENCSGGSLFHMLERPENSFGFEENDFKQVVFDVVSGMKYLTEQGLIHRDIKPGNILRYIKDDGSSIYKLTDFGAARELGPDELFTSVYGTEEYLHPDVYERGVLKRQAPKQFGANIDLWSLGVTFFHVATGKLPFRAFQSRVNRLKMYEILTKKKPGIISGIQKDDNGPVEWSDRLPEHTRLSQGLKEILVKILARLLEADVEKGMKFNELFDAVENIKAMKVIHVYSLHSGTFYTIYANPNDNFARFQELVAIQTGVGARQQDLFFNNDVFKPSPMETVSSYPLTKVNQPVLVLGGNMVPSEKLFTQLDLKTTKFTKPFTLNDLQQDHTVSKITAKSIYRCLYDVKNLELSTELMLAAADNVVMLLRRKAKKYLDSAKAIENHCQCIVMKHKTLLNGCDFEVEVLQTLGDDKDIPEKIVNELKILTKETESFKTKMEALQMQMAEPLKLLQTTAQSLLLENELTKLWENMNNVGEAKNYTKIVETYALKVEKIVYSFGCRSQRKHQCVQSDLEDHKFERLRLLEYFEKAKEVLEECQLRRQTVHDNFKKWLETVFDRRSNLKKRREELESFADMFSALSVSEEQWRANHMTRMKNILSEVRSQVRRAISVQSNSSDQQYVDKDDLPNGRKGAEIRSVFIEDINEQLLQLSTETHEAKKQLQQGTETFQKFVQDLLDELGKKKKEADDL